MTVLNFLTSLRIFQEQTKMWDLRDQRFERHQGRTMKTDLQVSLWRLTSKPGVCLLEPVNDASLVSLQVNTLLQMKDHRSLARSSYPATMETFYKAFQLSCEETQPFQCSGFLRLLCCRLEVHRSSYFHDILQIPKGHWDPFFGLNACWIACWRVNFHLSTVLEIPFNCFLP